MSGQSLLLHSRTAEVLLSAVNFDLSLRALHCRCFAAVACLTASASVLQCRKTLYFCKPLWSAHATAPQTPSCLRCCRGDCRVSACLVDLLNLGASAAGSATC